MFTSKRTHIILNLQNAALVATSPQSLEQQKGLKSVEAVSNSTKALLKSYHKMIYIDPPQLRFVKRRGEFLRTSHLISDQSVEELHAFVEEMGLSKRGFHDKPGQPHYDLLEGMVDDALAHGAKQVSTREIIQLLKQQYSSSL